MKIEAPKTLQKNIILNVRQPERLFQQRSQSPKDLKIQDLKGIFNKLNVDLPKTNISESLRVFYVTMPMYKGW